MGGTRKGVGAYLSLSLRGREVGWALIRGWALIKFFCLQDGRLFEVGANSRLGAYSNKYGTRISLGFAQNKGSSRGRRGIRNLHIVSFPRTNFMKNSFIYSGAVLRNSLPCDMREVNLNDWLI